MKKLSFIFGILGAFVLLFVSCTHESVVSQLAFGALAGLCAYVGVFRKLDLEDDAQLATGVNKWAIYLIIALILIFSLLIFFANYEETLMLSDDPLEIFNMRRF